MRFFQDSLVCVIYHVIMYIVLYMYFRGSFKRCFTLLMLNFSNGILLPANTLRRILAYCDKGTFKTDLKTAEQVPRLSNFFHAQLS